MVSVTDRESLENWLWGQSRGISVVVASRAAQRLYPLSVFRFKFNSRDYNLALLSGRALLVSMVAVDSPTVDIKRAATDAAANAATAATNANTNAASASNATNAAANAANAAAASTDAAANAATATASVNATTIITNIWQAISNDLAVFEMGNDVNAVLDLPLWPEENPLAPVWEEKITYLHEQDEDWSFWIDWYQRALDGRQQNWEVLGEIALIKTRDWGKGAGHVNGLIAEIQARYLHKFTPYSETIEINPETGRLRSVATPMGNEKLFQTALDKVRDALADLRPNGELAQHHAGLERVATRLDRTLGRYADNPQRVHDDFLLSAKQVSALVETTEVAEDEDVDALQSSLVTGADDIRAADAEVKASVAARVALRIEEMRVEDTEVIAEAVEVIESLSEGDLKESSHDDVEFYRSTDRMGMPIFGPANYEESISYLFRTSAQISASQPLLPEVVDVGGRAGKGLVNGYTVAEILNKAITLLLSMFS